MAKKKVFQRGGSRDGTGRPSLSPEADTVRVATDPPAGLVALFGIYAKQHESKPVAVIRETVVAFLDSQISVQQGLRSHPQRQPPVTGYKTVAPSKRRAALR